MFRYKFTIEYDGSASEVGWQSQPEKISIQSILSDAAKKLCQKDVVFHGAGRTDKGVHAYGQVAHADFVKKIPLLSLKRGMNFYLLNKRVSIKEVEHVENDFHSRFNAKLKKYRYDLCIRDYPNVLNLKVWKLHKSLDINLMKKASNFLLGEHDFTSFRDTNCQALSPIRSIENIYFEIKDDIVSVFFIAKSFLHHQVRVMVGTLVDVGKGRIDYDIRNILESKCRCDAGPTAPALGLFLESIDFE